MGMDKIIGLGNALVDVLATLDNDDLLRELDLPKGGMTLIDGDRLERVNSRLEHMPTHRATGGSASNTIAALAALGTPTAFIGQVGRDSYGDFFRHCLQGRGTDDHLIVSQTLPSGVATTFISPDGERTFATHLGAAAALRADDLKAELFEGCHTLYVEGYLVQDHDLILQAIRLAKAAGLQVCLDLASYTVVREERNFFHQLLTQYANIVLANEEEARAFTEREPEGALVELAGLCGMAVVKVGSRGALLRRGSEEACVPAQTVSHVVDTTGAGDFFAAGLLYGLACGFPLERCGRIGAKTAAEVIQVIGTTLPSSKWEEIKEWIEINH